jgi:hypothetical protein
MNIHTNKKRSDGGIGVEWRDAKALLRRAGHQKFRTFQGWAYRSKQGEFKDMGGSQTDRSDRQQCQQVAKF